MSVEPLVELLNALRHPFRPKTLHGEGKNRKPAMDVQKKLHVV